MTSFNKLLSASGLDPREVILLRHSQAAHRLFQKDRAAFELYQSTQEPRWEQSCSRSLWASFFATPNQGALFLGLYSAARQDSRKINWRSPLTGEQLDHRANLYRLTPLPQLAALGSKLRIDWGGGFRTWIQYADKNDKQITGPSNVFALLASAGEGRKSPPAPAEEPALEEPTPGEGERPLPEPESPEGAEIWKLQRSRERDRSLVSEAKRRNRERNGGRLACEACSFSYGASGMFDAHHKHPLLAGERESSVEDLAILCPTCHRQAHLSPNRRALWRRGFAGLGRGGQAGSGLKRRSGGGKHPPLLHIKKRPRRTAQWTLFFRRQRDQANLLSLGKPRGAMAPAAPRVPSHCARSGSWRRRPPFSLQLRPSARTSVRTSDSSAPL